MKPVDVYERLLLRFGPQGWWPADTPLEVCLGAILTQNTNWGNVRRALAGLRRETELEYERLRVLKEGRLAELIRPAGYFNQKARKLHIFFAWLEREAGGDLAGLAVRTTVELRGELLGLWGIGPETADSILCYALGRPVFVVDAYTRRAARRHGWCAAGTGYDDLAELFTAGLPRDAGVYNELHALLVRLAKAHCAKRGPRCRGCPLIDLGFTETRRSWGS